jgi:hypothetical protein
VVTVWAELGRRGQSLCCFSPWLWLAHIIHKGFYCNRRYAAATSLAGKIDGKGLLRREVIERGGTSKHGLAGGLAPRDLNIQFQVCFGLLGLRVLVSQGDLAVSSRTVMNHVG